jgi:sugar/nucleoside kinase (ribokinase family)
MVRGLDALYLNFISGFELNLGTAQALRQAFAGPIYADFHSLLLGMGPDGMRMFRPLPDAPSWFGCFDVIQVNEEEMNQMSSDPMTLAAAILGAGARALIVTLGARGAVYVTTAGGPDGQTATGSEAVRHLLGSRHPAVLPSVLTSALVPGERVEEPLDPTGCGDVFGGAVFSRLLAGDTLENAVTAGNRAAARNVAYRGASGLAQHLRGELVAP